MAFMNIANPLRQVEIDIVSAKLPLTRPRFFSLQHRLETYVVAWINPRDKVSTKIDTVGGREPKWGEKFVLPYDSEADVVTVEVHAVGRSDKDHLLGTARIPIRDDILGRNGGVFGVSSFPVYPKGRTTTNYLVELGLQVVEKGFDQTNNFDISSSSWVAPYMQRKFSALSLTF